MEYPYTTINCRTQDGESSATVAVVVTESGIDVDEGELVTLVRTYLAGLPGVATTNATRFSVMQETLPEV
ncbi:hypothetical protein ACFWMG_04555 [Streptomyces sp. NPDC127074]|uniref:hypothetical protein n=1 Tax=Streptomyces sp. NPDC127074 TaxID=3347130 RepID=UPI00364DF148